ncbi:AI-2E family transporter [Anaerofilum sp. BX8]|uniref:AI-2E family transporter n=1 Tax=Anaerofilum hominis TaxID=2763016 RepID=A0A923I8X2_9FIRM|nr:AI-2E family transporter [Anaerofilum hominis]MBC5580991.1 AI-2E family transporter [Anaerofilum hominis]
MKEKNKWLWSHRTLANLFVVLVGIAFYLCLSNFDLVRGKVAEVVKIFTPFIAGFALAYLLNLPMRFFERRVFRRFRARRGLAILASYLLAGVVLAVLLGLVLPQLVQSVMALAANVPIYLRNLNELLDFVIDKFHVDEEIVSQLGMTYKEIVQKLTAIVTAAAPQLLNFSVALGSGVVTGLTALISSIYMLAGKDKLIFQLKKVVYALMPTPKAKRFLSVCGHANGVFAGFINGKLIDSAIIGVLCFVCMSLLRMPLALLISAVVGATNVIPFFGPFIGAIPSVMILLIVDPWSALWFCILIILLQQFDGNILGPKILGDSTGLSAIWVLVAIIVGGGLFGFAGMLLGVPAFAVLYSLSSDFIAARLAARGVDAAGEPLQPPQEKTEEERAQ